MMTTTTKATVETVEFERAHGRMPRGFGSWAFCPFEHYRSSDYLDHVFWFTGTYGAAKRAAVAHFSALGVADVVVCS